MNEQDGVTVSQEYTTLRAELLEAKRYVFERPLLLAALWLAGAGAVQKGYAPVLLLIFMVLLLFNFWFTTNRLISSSRIVAYIQLVLEEQPWRRGRGWETCLRHYRSWLQTQKEPQAFIDEKLVQAAPAPDALGYYPAIYWLHVGMFAASAAGQLYFVGLTPTGFTVWCSNARCINSGCLLGCKTQASPHEIRDRAE